MPDTPERQEPEAETMTIPQLADRVGKSRQLLHRLATNPAEGWPAPVFKEGSSRPEYDVVWFDEYWARRQSGIRQGKRTDLQRKKEQGEAPMSEVRTAARPLSADARAILGIVWKWIADANDGYGSDVGGLMHELESAGYGPVETEE